MTSTSSFSSKSDYLLEELPRFPRTLFYFKQYDGGKTFVVFIFFLSAIYLLSGFWGFIIEHNLWFHDLVYGHSATIAQTSPAPWWKIWKHLQHNPITNLLSYVDLFFRLLIFSCAYCITWVTFDPKNVEGYVMGAFNAFLGGVCMLSPIDAIPDVLPIVGSLDDAILGFGMMFLGVSSCYRAKLRDEKTQAILELVNHGNREKALQLLLKDKGISITVHDEQV